MNEKKLSDNHAYKRLCTVLARTARRNTGMTIADATAATALPLAQVRELLPCAADEYCARLAVTESGEILYSFPKGMVSRYRGFGVGLKKAAGKFLTGVGVAAAFLFKAWIMVMLIGYFVLFLALALASVFLSVAGSSKSSNRRRGSTFIGGHGLLNFFIRLWFFSELTKPRRMGGMTTMPRSTKRLLHKAVFSFVFGDEDPNKEWDQKIKKDVIAYIQANKGIISLPEFMTLIGKDSLHAEEALMAFCVEFGGSPEATEDGTIIYRFEELLLRADTQDKSFKSLSPPIAMLKNFSSNPKSMNIWFCIINAVNLIFGSYFLNQATRYSTVIFTDEHKVKSLYQFVYALFCSVSHNPAPAIAIGLGLVPLVFSILFWLIPAIRLRFTNAENEKLKLENLRRLGFGRIWSKPTAVTGNDIDSQLKECRPKNFNGAREKIIKEMGAYSLPEVSIDQSGQTVYSFAGLEREQQALKKCRFAVKDEKSQLGGLVFDTGE